MFLVTTALDEFWDAKQEKILLAGEWCRLYGREHSVEEECLPYLWSNSKNVYEAQLYCNEVYENVLTWMTKELNCYLGLNRNTHYYRILLGNWLIHFVHQAYDKYLIFKSAKEYGATKTWSLDPEQFYYPTDLIDFISRSDNDLYQLQLFSQVAKYLDFNTETKPVQNPSLQNLSPSKRSTPFGQVKLSLKYLFLVLSQSFASFFHGKKHLIVVNPYFKKNSFLFIIKLWLKSHGALVFDGFNYSLEKYDKAVDMNFRSQYKKVSSEFENWIKNFALTNIPQVYLEYHHDYIKLVKSLYLKKGSSIFTYNDLYHNTQLQYFLALNNEKTKILSAQHGCGYGMDVRHEGEVFERSISHRFYTYGWTDSEQTMPLPIPMLIKESKKYITQKKILFLTTSRPRFTIRFFQAPSSSKMLTDHVEYPLRFLNKLNYFEHLVIRHHALHDVRKWNNRQRIKAVFPDIVEDKNQSFYNTLEQSKIFVSDHMGTTFLEAMQANIPTIIFINKTTYMFRDSFQIYIDKFIQEKILFYDPDIAADHINSVYADIDVWWESATVQKIRKDFVREHSLTADNWMDVWCSTLRSFC
jgi:putative transferase (TIGR04331 family)